MRRLSHVVAVAFGLLVAVVAMPTLASANDVKQVPIGGVESWVVDPSGGVIFCGGLPDPLARQVLTEGRFTHLGRTSAVLTFDACELTAGGLVIDGHATRTTANGDLFYAVWQSTIDPASGAELGTVTFVGGTGRFASATGSGTYRGMVDISAGQGWFAVTGTISVVGANW